MRPREPAHLAGPRHSVRDAAAELRGRDGRGPPLQEQAPPGANGCARAGAEQEAAGPQHGQHERRVH
eukprot:14091088-Alexandrium_andersonii.AAC.1